MADNAVGQITICAVGGVCAAAVFAAATLGVKKLRQQSELKTLGVQLKLAQDLPPGCRLMFRYVRDGKDEVPGHGELVNENHAFRRKSGSDWRLKIKYPRNIGFQFKCYVEFSEHLKGLITGLLEDSGFTEVSADGETPDSRMWFLLPGVPICKTADHTPFTNNYCYSADKIVHPT